MTTDRPEPDDEAHGALTELEREYAEAAATHQIVRLIVRAFEKGTGLHNVDTMANGDVWQPALVVKGVFESLAFDTKYDMHQAKKALDKFHEEPF